MPAPKPAAHSPTPPLDYSENLVTPLFIGVLRRPVEFAQYTAVRYSQRLAEEGAVASVSSVGDGYDNAMAEAFNSLFKPN